MLELGVPVPDCVCVSVCVCGSPGLLPAWAELLSPGPGRVPSVAGAVAQALLSAPRYQAQPWVTPGGFGVTLSPSGLTPHLACAQVSLSCRPLSCRLS